MPKWCGIYISYSWIGCFKQENHMILKKKYTIFKILALSIISVFLAGCFETMKKTYDEGAAATSSVIESTKKLFGGKDNEELKQVESEQQAQSKPQQKTPVKQGQASKPVVKKKTSQQLKNEAKEAQYEHVTYKSPAPDVIHSYTFRAYKGLYIAPVALPDHPGIKIKYHDLLSIKDAKHTLNKERLKNKFDGNTLMSKKDSPYEWVDGAWWNMINNMARSTRTYKACEKDICTQEMINKSARDKRSCSRVCSKQKTGWHRQDKTVFEKRRSFNKYIDNELDKVILLAQQAKHEVYIKGNARLTSYQFDLGGFLINGIDFRNPLAIQGSLANADQKKKKNPIFKSRRFGSGKNVKYGVLYKMSQSKAEKFIEELSTKAKNNKQVWYVYKVRLKPHKSSYIQKTKTYRVDGMFYDYDILSRKMEFYYDEDLKQKAFEMPMK